jgi:hypothetical protein
LNHWRALLLFIVVWSCNQPAERRQRNVMVYYDIKGLIDEQILLLDSVSPQLYKEAVINGTREMQLYTPEDSAWIKELEIFISADINKPMLADSYSTMERQMDSGKSLLYISRFPRATLVDTLTVLLDREGKLQKVQAYLENANALFTSVKTLEMNFTDKYGRQVLSGYTVIGWQKMMSKDSLSFNIEAGIEYP